jgi:hypothetical protein
MKKKNICDSGFTLDDLIQESVEINNFLKGKTNKQYQEDNIYENLSKFFSRSVKLRNATKNTCWEKSSSKNIVS